MTISELQMLDHSQILELSEPIQGHPPVLKHGLLHFGDPQPRFISLNELLKSLWLCLSFTFALPSAPLPSEC